MDIDLYETDFPGIYVTEDGYFVDDNGSVYDSDGDLIEENTLVLNESLGYNGVLRLARQGKIKIRGANRASTVAQIKAHGGNVYKHMLDMDKNGVYNKKIIAKIHPGKAQLQSMRYQGGNLTDKVANIDKVWKDYKINNESDIARRRLKSGWIKNKLSTGSGVTASGKYATGVRSGELKYAKARNILARLGKKK